MGGTSMSRAQQWASLYPIACCECGVASLQVGKMLPKGWRWECNGMAQWYYCPSVICWQYSWVRSREEWASA